jgi:hypothetical protein
VRASDGTSIIWSIVLLSEYYHFSTEVILLARAPAGPVLEEHSRPWYMFTPALIPRGSTASPAARAGTPLRGTALRRGR